MIKLLLQNKHTSGAAAVYILAKLATQAAAIWLPHHKDQFDSTANLLESAAIGYGLLAAGDGAKSVTREEFDTAIMQKPVTKP